jgi:hypothetical protein
MDEQQKLSADDIMTALRINSGFYEREMVEAAIERKDEIIPRLIEVLRKLLDDPTPYIENEEWFDHLYAVMLLGHLQVAEAHPIIIDLFSLPVEIIDPIFGDTITSDLPGILMRTCGGDLESIKAMVLNRKVDVYCRNSAARAMTYAVVEGIASRETVLDFFATLFTGDEADENPDFWGLLACSFYEMCPEGYMAVIRKAYEDELIDSQIIAYQDFESSLAAGQEAMLEKLTVSYQRFTLIDIHESMSWWACFQPDEAPRPEPDLSHPFTDMPGKMSTKAQQKDSKAAKKKKRKQAKASRKKNRRR